MTTRRAEADDSFVPNKVFVLAPYSSIEAESDRVAVMKGDLQWYEQALGERERAFTSLKHEYAVMDELSWDVDAWLNTESARLKHLHEDQDRLWKENVRLKAELKTLVDENRRLNLLRGGNRRLKDFLANNKASLSDQSGAVQKTSREVQTESDEVVLLQEQLTSLRATFESLRSRDEKCQQELMRSTIEAFGNLVLPDDVDLPDKDEGNERVFSIKFRYPVSLSTHVRSEESEAPSPGVSPVSTSSPLSSAPPSPPLPQVLVATPTPIASDWIEVAKVYLELPVDTSSTFPQLIHAWATAESTHAPTKGLARAPQEILNWKKKKGVERYTKDSEPNINYDFARKFPDVVWSWWFAVQPGLRGPPTEKILPAYDGKWTNIERWGENGWVLLLIALKWWWLGLDKLKDTQKEAGEEDWTLAVTQFFETFRAMTSGNSDR
ncbi:SERTA domain-containing protein 3 [Marasmius crinis-equi]|uniref:SERTA domain-containing protein 3 n=1 Tax=Marasmius crinis-equi TaxID=585013 RepID=A0ABR3ENF6_9AGAR